MTQAAASLSEKFLEYFDITFAVSAEQKAEVYGIRYSVYCDEFAYEPADLFPDHKETDEFDTDALHALVTHKSSGLRAGCVRLVRPSGLHDGELLPFEKYCKGSVNEEFIRNLHLDRNTVCEISRLAVEATFRRRPGERATRFGEIDALDCSQQERRTFSIIAVACFLAATALIDLTGRNSVFAMMEPFLPRLLKRSGLAFTRAGTDIDYHGLRAPYFINKPQDMISPDLMNFYSEIHRRMKRDYPG